MKQFTDITILVDRSGSMNAIRTGMEGAFRTFLKEHRTVPSTRLTLIQFDDINPQEVVYQAVPVADAAELNLIPRGGTPLLDAMCDAIDRTGERLRNMRERDRPDQVLFIIITDGQENTSRRFRRSDVFDRITRQREDFKWQFVYLGANQDAFGEASSYGIPIGSTITWSPTPYFVGENSGFAQSYSAMSLDLVNNAAGARGMSTSFTEDQRTKSATASDRAAEQQHQPTTTSGSTTSTPKT